MERTREVLKAMAGLKADMPDTKIDAHLAAMGRPHALVAHERWIRDAIADAEKEVAIERESARLRSALDTLMTACLLA